MEFESGGSCECLGTAWTCPAGAGGLPPQERLTESGMTMLNLTGHSLSTSDYILETFHDFVQSRYDVLHTRTLTPSPDELKPF